MRRSAIHGLSPIRIHALLYHMLHGQIPAGGRGATDAAKLSQRPCAAHLRQSQRVRRILPGLLDIVNFPVSLQRGTSITSTTITCTTTLSRSPVCVSLWRDSLHNIFRVSIPGWFCVSYSCMKQMAELRSQPSIVTLQSLSWMSEFHKI